MYSMEQLRVGSSAPAGARKAHRGKSFLGQSEPLQRLLTIARRPRRPLFAVIVVAAMALGLLANVNVGAASAATCPCSVFTSTQVPSVASDSDSSAVELGMKFRSDQTGFI